MTRLIAILFPVFADCKQRIADSWLYQANRRIADQILTSMRFLDPAKKHDIRFMMSPLAMSWWLLLVLGIAVSCPPASRAETPAPSVHWGAIAYPDRDRTLEMGLTLNRFTEFDGAGNRYNAIGETAGFNFASLSWTERLARFPGWNSNLTVGAGPTQDGLTRFLQNDVVHKFRGLTPVPVGAKRDGTDFMIGGSLTRWVALFGSREQAFAGLGMASGSLYHEPYVQMGLRRFSFAELAQASWGTGSGLETFSHFVRFSAMGRYGRLYGGSAYPTVAPQSYLGQASISLADYRDEADSPPRWELELAITIDSCLFVDFKGDALEERFVSLVLRFPYVTFETWNDLINQKDYGPTFGARLTLDLLQIYDRWRNPS